MIPIVTTAGGQLRRVPRSQAVSILADAHVAYCNSSNRYSGMSFRWKLSENGMGIDHLISSSRNPYKFFLSSFALDAGSSYTISIIVTDTQFGGQSSATVIVEVVLSDVVAIISGGASRVWRVDDGNITVDASNSYDPDAMGEDSSILEYKWSCDQSQSLVLLSSSFCTEVMPMALGLSSSSHLSLDMSMADPSSWIGASFAILLEVVGSLNRTDTTSVSYTILRSDSPKISFVSDPPQKINPLSRLELMTLIEISTESVADWSVNDRNLDLSAVALTPTSAEFSTQGNYMYNFVIGKFELVAGSLYDFSLSVTSLGDDNHHATVTVTIEVIEAPHPGEFHVSPTEGREFQDLFSFSTSRWSNDELPLTYTFGYFEGLDSDYRDAIALSGRSEYAFLSDQLLPGGQRVNNYTLACGVYAFNNLDARSYLVKRVHVYKVHFPVEDMSANILTQLLVASSYQDSNKLKSVISVGISMLNSANCSLAPSSCESLGRHECHKISHSCGSCLPEFVGQDEGEGNSPCYHVSGDSSPPTISANSSCVENSNCADLQVCDDGRCVFRAKLCPSDCSDKGTCLLEAISTGIEVQQCRMNDFTCRARCECDDGYLGKGCSESQSSMAVKQDTRLQLILSLNDTLQNEDASDDSITSLIRRVIDAGSVSAELVESSCFVLQSIITSVLALAAEAPDPSAIAVFGLFEVLDNCDEVYSRSSNSSDDQGVPRKLSTEQKRAVKDNNDLMDKLSIFTVESMLAGERTKSFIQSYSRLSMSKNTVNAAGKQHVPQTQLESFFGNSRTMIQWEGSDFGDNTVTKSVILKEIEIFNSSLTSNPISVHQVYDSADENTLSGLGSPHVLITIQNKNPQKYVTRNESVNATRFITLCSFSNLSQSINYTCPNGEVVSHVCGTVNEIITSECPTQLFLPTCVILSSTGTQSSCDLVSFTPTNVTCNCSVTLHQSDVEKGTGRRRLFRSRSAQSSGYIEIATMSQHTYEGVISTNRDVAELSAGDVVNGLTIIVMFSIFWGCGVLGLFELIRNSWFSCYREVKPRERKRKLTTSDSVSLEAKKDYLLR